MGATSCSQAEFGEPEGSITKGRGAASSASSKAPRPLPEDGASAGKDGTQQSLSYWHDKMTLSAASQAVFEGAQRGDAQRVLAALNAHGDPNCVNFGGYTALMLAVGGGFREVAALLLQASANPNCALSGLTPLMIAAASGQFDVARMLVNCGASSTGHDKMQGRTALHRAAERGHDELARLLVQAGASVDMGDFQDTTALMLAAENGHPEVLRVLLCSGASVSLANKQGESALSKCVKKGQEGCLETMLRAGAPVNAANRATGDPALAEAARLGSEGACRKLLQYQANVNLRNQRKETPLMLASGGGHAQVAHMLLLAGADTTTQDLNGHTALMHGASSGSVGVVSALLDFGSGPSAVSQVDCNTPLTLAAAFGNAEAYDLLVRAGGTVSALAPEEAELAAGQLPLASIAGGA